MMGGGGMMGGGMMGGAWGGAWPILGSVFMILFWALIIAGTVWLVLTIAQSLQRQSPRSSGLAILEERLARGEIDVEEYRSRKSVLGGV